MRMICTLALLAALAAPALAAGLQPDLMPGTPVRDAGAWTADPQRFNFVVLGDRRGGADEEWPVFDRALEEMNRLNPDFVIMPGDLIEGYSAEPEAMAAMWKDFWKHADVLEAPLLVLPGNHDISNPEMLQYWKENLGRTYYSFDYQGCHFLALNTQEHWVDNSSSFGPEQVQFALDDLAKHAGARHTFVFMHVPIWRDGGHPEWAQIEQALGSRPFTVIASHEHRLSHDTRNDRRYIIVGATKGVTVDGPNELPELGAFPHYTHVTVDGDAVEFAYIEPGNIWPEDVAPRALQLGLAKLINVAAKPPQGLDGAGARTGLTVSLDSSLPVPVAVAVSLSGLEPGGWQLAEGEASRRLEVAPGSKQTAEFDFAVPAGKIVPVPRNRCALEYKGKTIFGFERNAPLFPEEALRHVPEWSAAGPYPAADLPRALPENPREAMPAMFTDHGPEKGVQAGDAVSWKPVKAEPGFGDGFVNLLPIATETPVNVLAYAMCGIRSPRDRVVYAKFRVDDYGQILVNGRPLEDGRVFRTRSDATWVALPLRAGWNTVIVKAATLTGGGSFGFLVGDPQQELEFAARPAE